MKIKLDKNVLVNKFLAPIAKVSERCVISVYPDHIQSLVSNSTGNMILYANVDVPSDLGDEKEVNLNVSNVARLSRMLDCVNGDEVELVVNSNSIEYKSLNMNFTYHLMEDGVIKSAPVKVEKIKNIKFNTDFVIGQDSASDIMKGTSFAVDSNKIYFYTKDKKVFSELTDKESPNTDSVSYFITDTFSGEELKKPMLIDLEIFKTVAYSLKGDITTKFNIKNRTVMFKLEGSDYTLQYIIEGLIK